MIHHKHKIFIFSGIFLVLVMGVFLFLRTPLLNLKHVATKRNQTEKKLALRKRQHSEFESMKKFKGPLSFFNQAVNLPRLTTELLNIAEKKSLVVEEIIPQRQNRVGRFKVGAITINVLGNYIDIVNFIKTLAVLPYIFLFLEFQLKKTSEQVAIHLVITVYSQ